MKIFTILGRYLFCIPFIIIGILYLVHAGQEVSAVAFTGDVALDFVAGLAFLLAGIAVLIGRKDTVATTLLGLFLLLYVLIVNMPDVISTSGKDTVLLFDLLKNVALAGASLSYARSASRDRSTRLT